MRRADLPAAINAAFKLIYVGRTRSEDAIIVFRKKSAIFNGSACVFGALSTMSADDFGNYLKKCRPAKNLIFKIEQTNLM